MRKTQRKPCSKIKNDEHFERNRCSNARSIPSGAFKELQTVVVGKKDIWDSFGEDTQGFISAWPKGAIVEVTNITRGMQWKK